MERQKQKGKFFTLIDGALNEPASRNFVLVNDFLAAITLLSILGIALETVAALGAYQNIFRGIEYFTVLFFSLEYAARIWTAEHKRKYIFSFFGAIDLLAVLPTYFHLTNLTFLKSSRSLRILRFLRMVRLAKISRIRRLKADPEDYIGVFKANIKIYFFSLFVTVVVLGSLIYVFEHQNQHFASIPTGMLWATETVIGGSISAKLPTTLGGNITTILARFMGLVLLGLLISVVGGAARKILFGTKKI